MRTPLSRMGEYDPRHFDRRNARRAAPKFERWAKKSGGIMVPEVQLWLKKSRTELPASTILDYGCGTAAVSPILAELGPVLAVDFNPAMLGEARRRCARIPAVTVQQVGPYGDGLAENSVGLVWARLVMHHVKHSHKLLRAFYRTLQPGGRIILQDPDISCWHCVPSSPQFNALWKGLIAHCRKLNDNPTVGHRLGALCHQAGFRDVEVRVNFRTTSMRDKNWIEPCRVWLSQLPSGVLARHRDAIAEQIDLGRKKGGFFYWPAFAVTGRKV